jgi:small subunit ribosomal protein S17
MSSIWNFANPLTSGSLKLAKSGRELYGTVVRAGLSKKTVSVKVNRFFYDQKYRKTYSRTGLFHVHDEEEFCRVGDKVVIQSCRPMSKLKRYFVRNVVVMAGRPFELGAVTADKKVEMLEEKNRLKVEQMAKEKAEEDAKVEKKLDPIWLGLVEDMKFEERTGRNFEYRKDVARKSPDNSFEQKKGKKLNEGRKGLKKNELEKDILESKGQNVGNLGNEEAGVGLGGKEEIIDRSEVKEVKKEIEERC